MGHIVGILLFPGGGEESYRSAEQILRAVSKLGMFASGKAYLNGIAVALVEKPLYDTV